LASPDFSAALRPDITETSGRRPERWVLVTVEEAYIHCSKHIPRMEKVAEEARQWGTDDVRAKGGDYFQPNLRPEDDDHPLSIQETKKGEAICPYCGVGCRLLMESADGELIRVKGVADAPANLGGICAKGRPCPR